MNNKFKVGDRVKYVGSPLGDFYMPGNTGVVVKVDQRKGVFYPYHVALECEGLKSVCPCNPDELEIYKGA